jgi:hypothetical protein
MSVAVFFRSNKQCFFLTNSTFSRGLKAFSIVELPEATYRDPYRDGLKHGWTCRVLNGEVAIDAPVVHNIWRLQHLLACMSMYHIRQVIPSAWAGHTRFN